MPTLTVSQTTDYRLEPERSLVTGQNIALIDFTAAGTALFDATQFGGTNISSFVTIEGSMSDNEISVSMAPADVNFSAADWSFTNWDSSDTVTIVGSASADIIVGSTHDDTIWVSAFDNVQGGDGADSFLVVGTTNSANANLNGGGSNFDRVLIDEGTVDLRALVLTSIEGLECLEFGNRAILSSSQVGVGKINLFSDERITGAFRVDVVGSAIDMRTAQFVVWNDDDFLQLEGTFVDDVIYGSSKRDKIFGAEGADYLDGGAGNDELNGGAGQDVLDGKGGADIMTGGADADTYYWDNALDQIIELAGGGTDQIRSFVSLDMNASAGLQQVERGYTYGSANITIYGNNLQNVLGGNGGNNRLEGRGGLDQISGGDGNDFIIGGADRDTMTGGAGRDGYRWYATTETGNTAGARDIITDFASITDTGNALTSDYLDLSPLDANTTNGTHVFAFIGFNTAFTAAGQLRYRHEGGNTVIEGNVDGNLASDFQIQLTGLETLVSADFML